MSDYSTVGSSPSNVGGYNFSEAWYGDSKDTWVTSLPADMQAKFNALDSAPPETRAALAEALVRDGLAAFDEAAKGANLTGEQLATMREAVEESLRGAAGTIFADRLSAEKIADMSIEDLMFFVMSERTKGLDRQIRAFAEEIQQRNNLMSYANDMLSEARNTYAGLDDDESATMSSEMAGFFESNGIELPAAEGRTDAAGVDLDPATKVSEAQSAIDDIDDVGYTDNACIKKDVPDDVMKLAEKYGIEVPNDGIGLKKSDFDTLKGSFNDLKAEGEVEVDNAAATTADGAPVEAPAAAQTLTRDQWDAAIQNVKGFLEGLNNQSELDMIKYQSTMSKYTSSIEMLSNTMKKLSDTKSAVVRNLG